MKAFFDAARGPVFGGRLDSGQVEGCEAILAASAHLPLRQRAYLLATAHHETAGTMLPVKETVMPHHRDRNPSDAEVIRRLDRAFAKGLLPQVREPYWREGWFGRGYVQLTHRRNYELARAKLGVDFVSDPSLAMVPEHAARILVRGCIEGWFTGRKLGDYTSYREMRRVVNGLDRAKDIAATAVLFEAALAADAAAAPAPEVPPPPDLAPPAPTVTAPPSGGFFMAIAALLRRWIRGN